MAGRAILNPSAVSMIETLLQYPTGAYFLKTTSQLLTLCSVLVLGACSSSNTTPTETQDTDETQETSGMQENTGNEGGSENNNTNTTATYKITFNSSWSQSTHPVLFPANPHFSGLVGAVHNDQVIFWEPGQIATDGIELMAETGGKSFFLNEIGSAISSGYAVSAIDGPGIVTSPGTASVEVSVTAEYPNVTLATMLAPSPDWFAGFHDVKLYESGAFVDNLTIDAVLYDSGTDSGLSYISSNSDTQPRSVIQSLTSDPADSSFIQGLPNVGQFIIERL